MIIFLHGPDTFRSYQKLQALKEKFSREVDQSGLNLAVLDGQTMVASAFEQAITTQPFLAKKRMVVVKNLFKNKGKKILAEVAEKLTSANLSDVILVFIEDEIKETQTTKPLLKILNRADHVQDFGLLSFSALASWVQATAKARGGSIEPSAVQALTSAIGNDLWALNNEIDKLVAYAGEAPVTTAMVATLVQIKLEDDIFKLTDAIGQRDKAAALRLIAEQLKSGASPTQLLAKITWQFRNLLLVKLMLEQGSSRAAEQSLGLHPFVIKKTTGQASRYSLADLKKMYRRLSSAEHQIKTSRVAPAVLLNLLVVAS